MTRWLFLFLPLLGSAQSFTHSQVGQWAHSANVDSLQLYFSSNPDWSEKISIEEIEFENLTLASSFLDGNEFKDYLSSCRKLTSVALSTAFNYALQKEKFGNAKTLLGHDQFDPDVPCSVCHGRTPVQQSILTTEGGSLVESSWEKSQKKWGYTDDGGNSTFYYAVVAQEPFLLAQVNPELLKLHGHAVNSDGITPFMFAAAKGMETLFLDIIKSQDAPPINYRKHISVDGQSLLSAAIYGANETIINWYLNKFGYDAAIWSASPNSLGLLEGLFAGNPLGFSLIVENPEFSELVGEAFISILNKNKDGLGLIALGIKEGWIDDTLIGLIYEIIA
ncbi:MAG: hypothetical protein ACI9YL_001075, partial [Luteibaculaceae bacterium]